MPSQKLISNSVKDKGLTISVFSLFIVSTFSIAGIEFFTIILMSFALWHYFSTDNLDKPPLWLVAPFFIWLIVALLSALVNPNFLRTLLNMKGEYRLLLPFALLPAFSKVRIRTLLKVYLVFVCIISIYSIIQFKFGVDWFRPEGKKLITPYMNLFHGKGNFSHHLTYAGFMLMNVPFFFALFLFDRDKQRYLWAIASIFSVLGVLVSLGRSCWVGTIVGLFILILILPKKISFPILGSGVILGMAFIYVASSGFIQEHIEPSNEHSVFLNRIVQTSITNDRDRLYLWEAGWLGFKDNPWIGVGIGNEDYRYEPYRKIVADKHGGHVFFNSASAGIHNLYLTILFVNGVIGLTVHFLLFVAVFAWCGKWIRYSTPNTRFETGLLWGTVGASTGILASSVFDNFFFDSEVQNLNMILFGLAIYAGLKIREHTASVNRPS